MRRVKRGGYGSGTGCAPPPHRPPPTPGVAARRKDWAPRVKCPPPLPSHAPVAGSPNALWAPVWRLTSVRPAPPCRRRPPPPYLGGGGVAHAFHPKELVLPRTAHHCHQSRVSLVVPGAALPHPPVPPAPLARGGPVCIAQGLHGTPLPHPP